MLSVPGSTPSSCMKRAHMRAPTTEAALFRVIVESINPKAAMRGQRKRVDREASEKENEPVAC